MPKGGRSGKHGKRGNYQSNVRIFLEYFLGERLEDYILRRRDEDPPRTWQGIADDMADIINRTALELDPSRPALNVRISSNLTFRLGQGEGQPPDEED